MTVAGVLILLLSVHRWWIFQLEQHENALFCRGFAVCSCFKITVFTKALEKPQTCRKRASEITIQFNYTRGNYTVAFTVSKIYSFPLNVTVIFIISSCFS